MSRSPSLVPVGLAGFGDDRGERRTTPFCYATPYSNAPEPPMAQRAGSRGPALYASNYYHDNNNNNDDDDEYMEDSHGSSTDVYDSEMTNDADHDDSHSNRQAGFPERHASPSNPDIDVYEDEPDKLDYSEASSDGDDCRHGESDWPGARLQSRHLVEQDHGHGQVQTISGLLPEDEPWPGIEDHMSDGENIHPSSAETNEVDIDLDEVDNASVVSSQPSEYPSTQRAWHVTAKAENDADGASAADDERIGFKIHEDGDFDILGAGIHW